MYSTLERQPTSRLLRPEKNIEKISSIDRFARRTASFLPKNRWRLRQFRQHFLPNIHRESVTLATLDNDKLEDRIKSFRNTAIKNSVNNSIVIEAFALIREVAGRRLGMYHFDSQLLGGLVLFYGNVAEMQTGEGKTLTATLPAATAALLGIPVHVITVNEYLAQRDKDIMAPVYEALGLSVACINSDMNLQERQAVYLHDIVYCTNKDLVFDYLKDQLVLEASHHPLHRYADFLSGTEDKAKSLMLRGLHFAIVDEADSVLMDEAITPLIISGETEKNLTEITVYQQAMDVAAHLNLDEHFSLDRKNRTATLTAAAETLLEDLCQPLGAYWRGRSRRNELVEKAIAAIFLFERGKEYLVVDDKIHIVDEHTGRTMPDRSWENGLHQLIEIKEQVPLTNGRSTLIKISYQRFFRKYHHLCGMTGTAKEVGGEFWSVYHLAVVNIPTHKKSLRVDYPYQVFQSQNQKWTAVIQQAVERASQGRAVLIGTSTVNTSELLSGILEQKGVPHQTLNAKQDGEEASVIAQAGQSKQITIATNMAGRGTDIKLSQDARKAGGLHVILTEFHDASRIDRQLFGRCARQGDPGSYEILVSLEDTLIGEAKRSRVFRYLVAFLSSRKIPTGLRFFLGKFILERLQKNKERIHANNRAQLLKSDDAERDMLAFVGRRI